jgi:hypothetical protein
MTPFDLPPDNPADWLCADDLRRPAEVRKAYLSKPPDDELRERDDVIEQQPQLPEPPPPGRGFISQPQQHPRPRVNGSFLVGVPTPLRASAHTA